MASKVKVQVPIPELVRNADGVLLNYDAYAKAVRAQKTRVRPDVLKPIIRSTNVCLFCKEFSKTTSHCNTCKREMLSFGQNVAKVKKGHKRGWLNFIKAYSVHIYVKCNHLYPDADIQRLWPHHFSSVPEKREEVYALIEIWVKDFDRFLDKEYRKK